MRIPRWPAIIILLACLGGLIWLDQRVADYDHSAIVVEGKPAFPVAAGEGSLGSTWYCTGGTGDTAGIADQVVTIANADLVTAVGTATVFGTQLIEGVGPVFVTPEIRAIEVAPNSVMTFALGEVLNVEYVAALLEFDSASVVVTHTVTGPAGVGASPCASNASSNWYFAGGTTARDALQLLLVFNPFADDAVVDITFATDDGARAPQVFDGVPVPARSLVPIDVTEVVARWPQLSTSVESRTGRVVVDRLVRFDGSEGLAGLSVATGSPEAAEVWVFPVGLAEPGVTQSYSVFNPSFEETAEVDVEVRLDSPETNGAVEPFELSIAPRRRVIVEIGDGAFHPSSANATITGTARVPAGIGHTVTVRTFNQVPIVAEQLTTAVDANSVATEAETTEGPVAASTGPLRGGVTFATGAPVGSTRQLLVVHPGTSTSLTIANPSLSTIARVSVVVVADGAAQALGEFTDIEIGAQRRLVINNLDELVPIGETYFLMVESSAPVIAQGMARPEGPTGMNTFVATPVGGELVVPDFFAE